jgi:hypothetical protein
MFNLLLFLTGAIVGTIFDTFHIYTGATSYSERSQPILFKIAWWAPIAFGFAAVFIGSVSVRLHRIMKESPAVSWPKAAAGLTYLGVFYFASGQLFQHPTALLGVILVGSGGAWLLFGRTKASLWTALLAALGGPLSEAILTHLRMFSHTLPEFLGLPYWAFALYGMSGITLGPHALKLFNHFQKNSRQ